MAIQVSVSAAGMGRPPLGLEPAMPVRFPKGTSERINALVGANRRALFIRLAVASVLDAIEVVAKLRKPPNSQKPRKRRRKAKQ